MPQPQPWGSSVLCRCLWAHRAILATALGSGTASSGPWSGDGNPDGPYLLPIHLDVSNVVLKHRGHVDLGELVLAEHDQQTRLSTGTISHNHQLLPDGCHGCGDTGR